MYTCGLAYLIGTALSGFPLASAIIAGAVTTIAIGVVFLYLRLAGLLHMPLSTGAALAHC